jgi:tetratricopeptide (TPR) repeat protein
MLLIGAREQFFPGKPSVEAMTGDVNIAVAEFGSIGPNGEVSVSEESSRLASSVYDFLDREINALEVGEDGLTDSDFEVQHPDVTGPVDGETSTDRAAQARKLGKRFSADIVIYAVIDEAAANTSMTPEFYLTDRNLVLDAEELIGEYQLGEPLQPTGSIASNIGARRELRTGLVNRTSGLLQLIVGLSYFGSGQYEHALDIFDTLEGGNLLTADAGGEILNLFQGNAAARLRNFDRAEQEYGDALLLRPGYSRAWVGLAEATYQRAHGGCRAESIDAGGVRRARDDYLAAGQSPDQPSGANIDDKVALGAGRAHLCLSLTGNEDAWDAARMQLDRVISAYEAGDTGITELVAEAWSNRGLLEIASPHSGEAALRRAVDDLTRAIEVGAPGRAYIWYGMLGFAHCRLDESEAALAAYDQAIQHSPDDAKRGEYASARTQAEASDPNACSASPGG